jgi:hypothetical protein
VKITTRSHIETKQIDRGRGEGGGEQHISLSISQKKMSPRVAIYFFFVIFFLLLQVSDDVVDGKK